MPPCPASPPPFRWTLLACALAWCAALPCWGYNANGQWLSTASEPTTSGLGEPVTLTWSIVPDGTTVPGYASSNLVSTLDSWVGGGSGAIEDRPWFSIVEQSFNRWSEVSGVDLVYEPSDNGQPVGNWAGQIGLRGDIRLAGTWIDGNGGTYGQTGYIDNADVTLDTGDTTRFGNSTDNYYNLRQTLMHEIGHSLGLGHNQALGAYTLMHPYAQPSIDGPQFDEIRGMHHLYGDVNERLTPGGNDTMATATSLGTLAVDSATIVGDDVLFTAGKILPDQSNFVSISSATDEDYYQFHLEEYAMVDLTLTPGGILYRESPSGFNYVEVNSKEQNDLSLALYSLVAGEAEQLGAMDLGGLGDAELLDGFHLAPGDYVVQVAGAGSDVQLYELALEIAADPSITTVAGDFNEDGLVDLADYAVWRNHLGLTSALANAPASPGVVDAADYLTWKANVGLAPTIAFAQPIPEPSAMLLMIGAGIIMLRRSDKAI